MKDLLSAIFLIAFSSPILAAGFEGLPITKQCGAESCTLQVISPYTKGGNNNESIGLALKYNLKSHSADFVAFLLPSNVDKNTELVISFVKTETNENKFILVPDKNEMIGLPINHCSDDTCGSIVHPEIKSANNKSINLFDKIKSKDHVWGTFRRNGKNETFMLPTYKFRDELSKIK